jgi:2-polyprenyl-3-methyl-5-hydroxy-6-metoxy-1,4-benzoquinol methylase
MTDRDQPTATVTAPPDAFKFGRNWQTFVAEHLDDERRRIAKESVADLCGDLTGKTFLDIGAGSGLFSLCAHELGAASVTSIDVDPDSVASCRNLHAAAGSPDDWKVLEGSILDKPLVEQLASADVVYSWGVLHHTGDMWTAIRNAASLVNPGGTFVIAIYNTASDRRFLDSDRWLKIKRTYVHSGRPVQKLMEWAYGGFLAANEIRRGRNPIQTSREYKQARGMARKTDLIDWIGGYPYEYATVDEIISFCERECGMTERRTIGLTPKDTGCNQFVFERTS